MRMLRGCLCAGFVLAASPCWAAAITNLSAVPQTLSYSEWGGEKTVTIPAGETLRIPGQVTFHYRGREVRIEGNEKYTIWRNGTLGPQRFMKRRGQPF